MGLSRQNQIYYYRCAIPKDLIGTNGQKELYVSLRTIDLNKALALANEIKSYLLIHFSILRQRNLPFARGRTNNTGNVMFDLIASLQINNSEVTIKSKNQDEFNSIVQRVLNTQVSSNKKQESSKSINAVSLLQLYNEFRDEKRNTLSPLTNRMYDNHYKYINLLFNGQTTATANREFGIKIRNIVTKLPNPLKYKHFYLENKNIDDIDETMNPASLTAAKQVFILVNAFFTWAVNSGKIDDNPCRGLKITATNPNSQAVGAYRIDELKTLFEGDNFDRFCSRAPHRYWIPVICLYTGMRLAECAQLGLCDVINSKENWFFAVNDTQVIPEVVKTLKNKHSNRVIPIPKKILELGFVDYYDQVKSEGYPFLFPDFHVEKNGIITSCLLANAWKSYKDSLSIGRNNVTLNFHSLRHTFVSTLKAKGVPLDVIQELVGHRYGTITFDVYGEPSGYERLNKAINLVDFDLNISHWINTPRHTIKRSKGWKKSCSRLGI